MRLSHHFMLCLLLLLPCGARADDIGPEQAASLQRQLQGWFAGLLGPVVKLPDLPWQITGEHDHYRIRWPIPGLDSTTGDGSVTALLRPLDGGRWSIDEVKAPLAGTFAVTVPDSGNAANSGPMQLGFTIGRQDTHGVIDPGLATASNLHSELGDFAVTTNGAQQHQEQHIDRYLVDTTLEPTKDGRLDLTTDATVSGWKSAVQVSDGKAVAIGIDAVHAVGRVEGVERDSLAGLLAAARNLIGTLPADTLPKENRGTLSEPARAQLRLMVTALQDMLTAVRLEETLDGLKVEVAGMGGVSMQHFRLGFGGEAPDSKLHVWFDFGLDGLDTPSLPPTLTAFLPHHIEMRPSLSGVQTADLKKLALDATEEGADRDSLTPDMLDILAHGHVDLGLETLSFDLGPAKVEGTGHVVVVSPGEWHGQAHLSASGLDELMTQARSSPDLQQALPVLIMLRGLAKPDGERLVWDVESNGPAVTVNGIDLSQMGGDKPKGKTPGHPQKR